MARSTTFNKDKAIATKGTDHIAVHTQDDVCKLADGTPAPFPNSIPSTHLDPGKTVRTFIDAQPVWTSEGFLGNNEDLLSYPAHAGIKKSVISGTYRGVCRAITFSHDVIIEGGGVVRTDDRTWQNGSC